MRKFKLINPVGYGTLEKGVVYSADQVPFGSVINVSYIVSCFPEDWQEIKDEQPEVFTDGNGY